jgi:hypothetical protein
MDRTDEYEILLGRDMDADGVYLSLSSRSDADGSTSTEKQQDGQSFDLAAWFRVEAERRPAHVDPRLIFASFT